MIKIVYIRTSTTEQFPEIQLRGISEMTNLDECITLSEKESAFKEGVSRTEFEKLQSFIKSGTVSDIFVWHLDRIHRNRKKLIEFLRLCHVYKVKVHSHQQQFLENLNKIPAPFDEIVFDMLIHIFGFMAEQESKTKGERVKNAVIKKEGKPTVSYKGNRWGKKPFSQTVVNKVRALSKEGLSIRNIASAIKIYDSNRNPKNISKSTVHKILTLS
jgi:DNA invertase Pin-like site-specific DNA recombinase